MNSYIAAQEAASQWGITLRQVRILCKLNCIVGATRISRNQIIPEDVEKPTSDKRKVEYCNE